MFSGLKDHPFAVEAFFKASFVLTFAFPAEQLQPLIPRCLELDLFDNQWAFLAVAVVDTKNLRPKGFHAFLGNDFILVGYRIFVKYYTRSGKRLRGLYILKSETDKMLMKLFGNTFTHYKYEKTEIGITQASNNVVTCSDKNGLFIKIDDSPGGVHLPIQSPFEDWKEARRFAGPLPFTFSYDPLSHEVLIVEGVRENWTPQPIKIIFYKIPFLEQMGLENGVLANAFIINSIPYYWKKGRKEIWQQ